MHFRPAGALPASLVRASVLAIATVLAAPAFGHGSHTHGHGTLNLVIEGNVLHGAFNFPLESLLGFDFPPSNSRQQLALNALKARLGDPAQFLEPAAEAGCTAVRTKVEPDLGSAAADADIPNIVYAFRFECARVEALQSVYFSAFRNHATLKQLRVELDAPSGRKTQTVRPKFPAITF